MILLSGVGLVSLSTGREFGPEWTKVKIPGADYSVYRKEINVPVLNYGRGGGSGYKIQLESDLVDIVEHDDNKGFYLESAQYGHFEVRRNADGTPAWHLIRFPKVAYYDLNGDGVFDVMQDSRESRITVSILMDGCFLRVQGGARTAWSGMTTAESPDGTKYFFRSGKWRTY
jgi:hypothetical protein